MTLLETYQRLQASKPTLQEIRAFKEQALSARDAHALKKGDILLADYFLENGSPQSALDLLRKSLEETDPKVDAENYQALLDLAIYAAISCKDYRQATRFLAIKKGLLDIANSAAVNRWYMESAYTAALMNQKARALSAFKAILTNNPTPETASLVLGNMTKLLLDEGDAREARKTLNEAIAVSTDLKDHAALRYCDYLSVKLAVLEGDNAFARDGFASFFKEMEEIPADYLEFYNEYIDFLIKTGDLALASKLASKERDHILSTGDKYLKREFLLSLIALSIKKTKKDPETEQALDQYIALDREITAEDYSSSYEETPAPSALSNPYATLAVEFKTFQNALAEKEMFPFLLNAFQRIDESFGPLEALAVFFDLSVFDPLHSLSDLRGTVKTASYKARRCYLRDISIAQLAGSVFEEELDGGKVITGRVSEGNTLKDPLSGRTLSEIGYQELAVYPLLDRGKVYGAIAFLYKIPVGLSKSRKDSLEVITTLFSLKYASLSLGERSDEAEAFLATALYGQTDGLFFLDPTKALMTLSRPLASYLSREERRCSRALYLESVTIASQELSKMNAALAHSEAYEIHYEYQRGDVGLPLVERALPIRLLARTVYAGTIAEEKESAQASSGAFKSEGDAISLLDELEKKKTDVNLKVGFLALGLEGLALVTPLSARDSFRRKFEDALRNTFPDDFIIARADGIYQVILLNQDQRHVEHSASLLATSVKKMAQGDVLLRSGLARYPRDGRDFIMLSKASLVLLNKARAARRNVAVFSEEFKRNWFADMEEESALTRILSSGKVKLRARALKTIEGAHGGYEITYDIPGLVPVSLSFPRSSALVERTAFAKLAFREIMKIKLNDTLYWHVSGRVLHELCLADYFTPIDKEAVARIVIICEDTLLSEDDFTKLYACGFRIFLSLDLYTKASLAYLARVPVAGISAEALLTPFIADLVTSEKLGLISSAKESLPRALVRTEQLMTV